jgi:hypothetical protein
MKWHFASSGLIWMAFSKAVAAIVGIGRVRQHPQVEEKDVILRLWVSVQMAETIPPLIRLAFGHRVAHKVSYPDIGAVEGHAHGTGPHVIITDMNAFGRFYLGQAAAS